MSLLDSLFSSVLGGGNKQQLLMQIASTLITNHGSGQGLNGLIQQLQKGGLGNAVNSWVGTGANDAVDGDQLHRALGPETVQQLSQQTGLQGNDLSSMLAKVLPQLIDKATPQGTVPPRNDVQSMLSGLLGSLGK